MNDRQQREFIASLKRSQINNLCLELQSIISKLKSFLREAHGYDAEDLGKIMLGNFSVRQQPPVRNDNTPINHKSEDTGRKPEQTPTRSTDLDQLKRDDENIRRSLTFELEWCIGQVEKGNYPV